MKSHESMAVMTFQISPVGKPGDFFHTGITGCWEKGINHYLGNERGRGEKTEASKRWEKRQRQRVFMGAARLEDGERI